MAQTNVNIRMDTETKQAFDRFCSEIGLSVSAAFNIFAKTVVREQRIPFELTTQVPNADTIAAVDEYYEMQKHPEKYTHYSSFAEILKEVEDDDAYQDYVESKLDEADVMAKSTEERMTHEEVFGGIRGLLHER